VKPLLGKKLPVLDLPYFGTQPRFFGEISRFARIGHSNQKFHYYCTALPFQRQAVSF